MGFLVKFIFIKELTYIWLHHFLFCDSLKIGGKFGLNVGVWMPYLTISALKEHIKNRDFSQIYFFYGEEKYLLRYFVKSIQESLLKKSNLEFNVQNFDAQNFEFKEFCNAVTSLPVFSNYKLVKISNFNFEKFKKNEARDFKSVLEELPKTTVLVIVQADVSRNEKTFAGQKMFLEFVEKNGASVEFKKMDKPALRKQLIFWAKAINTALSPLCADEIIFRCEGDLGTSKQELCKLCAFSGYQEVTIDMVDELCGKGFKTNVFLFSKMIAEQNYSSAYKHLLNLIENKNESFAILSAISASFVDLYRAKIAIENKKSVSEAAAIFDYKRAKFRIESAYRQSKKFTKRQLLRCLDVTVKTSFLFKKTNVNKEILLQKMIGKIAEDALQRI